MSDHLPGHTDGPSAELVAREGTSPESGVEAAEASSGDAAPPRPRVFGPYATWILVLPFVVYLGGMLLGDYFESLRIEIYEQAREHGSAEHPDQAQPQRDTLERDEAPQRPAPLPDQHSAEDAGTWFPKYRTWYPSTYTIVIAATAALMLIVSPGYFRAPFRLSFLSVIVGVAGVVVWVGLCLLDEKLLGLGASIAPHSRPAFNPLDELKDNPRWMYQFLAIRFAGLVLVVPVVEEFFLRGFLMRFIDDPDWDEIPLGESRMMGTLGATAYGVFVHMGEPLAAAVWFSMVTWMYLRTRSIWDCVVAHLITNLLLGIYILSTGHWSLW